MIIIIASVNKEKRIASLFFCLFVLCFLFVSSTFAVTDETSSSLSVTFSTPGTKTWTAPVSGVYKFEAWGGRGGDAKYTPGGAGGYTSGELSVDKGTVIYSYVGEAGKTATSTNSGLPTAFNGGGVSRNAQGGPFQEGGSAPRSFGTGGGATDFRLTGGIWNDFTSLKSRIMVAAGGGGSYCEQASSNNYTTCVTTYKGGDAGGLTGSNGAWNGTSYGSSGYGATQTTGGYAKIEGTWGAGGQNVSASEYAAYYGVDVNTHTKVGKFGYAEQNITAFATTTVAFAGGGGGYYGGGGSMHVNGGGGGSSFISGYPGCIAITAESTQNNIVHKSASAADAAVHYSGYAFTNAVMQAGSAATPYNSNGDGASRITHIATNFSVINQVSGANADTTLDFAYYVYGLTANTSYNYARLTSSNGTTWTQSDGGTINTDAIGSCSFTLRHNEKIVITIPAGATISVKESMDYRYGTSNNISSGSGVEDISVNTTDSVIFTNTKNKTDFPVKKVWNDSDNLDGYRPESLYMKINDNSNWTGNTAKLNGIGNEWLFTFTDIPESSNYTVEETAEEPEKMYLIKDGVPVNNAVTGGWQARGWASHTSEVDGAPTVMYTANSIHLSQIGGKRSGVFETMKDVDLTPYSKIYLESDGDMYGFYARLVLLLTDRTQTYSYDASPNGCVKYLTICNAHLHIVPVNLDVSCSRTASYIDISDVVGTYDIAVFIMTFIDNNGIYWVDGEQRVLTGNAHAFSNIYNMWLEK